jgi:hypothetical protein
MSAVIAENRVDASTDVEAVLNYTRNTVPSSSRA